MAAAPWVDEFDALEARTADVDVYVIVLRGEAKLVRRDADVEVSEKLNHDCAFAVGTACL